MVLPINRMLLLIRKFYVVFLILLPICIGDPSSIDKIVGVVDTKSPIVFQYEGAGDDSYFGYSLAFVKASSGKGKVKFEGEESSDHGTLFIGAPNEKRLTNNSGTVWSCKFSGGDGKASCSLLSAISEQTLPSSGRKRVRCGESYFDFREKEAEQWIGASLSASSKYQELYACAPRWKRNSYEYNNRCNDETAMVGACYFVGLDKGTISVELESPLNNPAMYHIYNDRTTMNEYLYNYAQFGMSSHVTWTDNLLVGAPNVNRWAGSYIEYNGKSREIRRPSNVEGSSLLGYSITSGRTNGRSYYIAVGAPRSRSGPSENLRGEVLVILSLSSNPVGAYKGEQFGSYFGSSVATVDLNGDGYDELLVGAPCHTPDFKSFASYSTGCVFVYDVSKLPNKEPLLRICTGSQENNFRVTKGARFGSAIVSLGDINFDKNEDFAVGAPFDDDGAGTVFIYYGGFPLSNKPVQIIRGKGLLSSLRGFGSQMLSAGSFVDVDGNNTPDLAIGSFESRHVVVLRTRPVAKPSIKITFHSEDSTKEKGEILKFLPTQKKLRVRICVAFSFSNGQKRENQLETWLSYDVDRREKRFEFDDGDNLEEKSLLSTTKEDCVDRHLRTIKDLTAEANENPIEFRATLWYNQTVTFESDPAQPSIMQISSQPTRSQSSSRARSSFNSYLPAPIPKTASELEKLSIASDDCDEDGNPNCDPKLKLEHEYKFLKIKIGKEPMSFSPMVPMIGELKTFSLSVDLSNTKETAYRPIFVVSFEFSDDFDVNMNVVRLEWDRLPGRFIECNVHRREQKKSSIRNTVRCNSPQALHKGGKFSYFMRLENLLDGVTVKDKLEGKLTFKIMAFPEGQPHELVEYTEAISLKTKVQLVVEDKAASEGQSAVDWKRNLVDLKQLYIIRNTGLGSISMDKVKAEIWVPAFVHVGKNATQVLGIANPSTLDLRCEPVNFKFFDPVQDIRSRDKASSNSSGNAGSRSRSSRSVKNGTLKLNVAYPQDSTLKTSSSDNVVTLSGCDTEVGRVSSSCQKIVCYTGLPTTESKEISLTMYLLQNALDDILTEETTELHVVSLISVSYPEDNVIVKTGTTYRKFVVIRGVEAWKFLLAAGIGAVLFVIFAFILYKCGFFRRKAKEQLKVLKRQTMMDMAAMNNFNIPGDDMEDEAEEVLD